MAKKETVSEANTRERRVKRLVLKGYPSPKQAEFFSARARHIAYGGARGGGKSWAMRRKLVLLALNYRGLKLLLLRRTLSELCENHFWPLLAELTGVARYSAKDRTFTFITGSRLRLGYCADEKDVFQYQGQEYDVIALEEATHFSERQMVFLTTCNRTTRTDFKPRMYYTCNPGNVGHAWVKRLFIDMQYEGGERAEDYVFVPARVYDNLPLIKANPEYLTALKNLPEDLRRAHLEGDWDVHAGQYFREFKRERHVVKPFAVPEWWRRFISIDWGYNDPCCALWHAVDGDGRVFTYREMYVSECKASDVAKEIKRLSAGEDIAYAVGSPDMWQKRGNSAGFVGESIAETFELNGVSVQSADNARVAGWNRVREYLADAPDKKPRWQVFENCQNLIRTLPLLIHSQRNVEDVAHNLEDHAAESLRYALMSRPIKSVKKTRKLPKYDPLAQPKTKGGFF